MACVSVACVVVSIDVAECRRGVRRRGSRRPAPSFASSCLLLVLLSSCPVGVHGGRRHGAVELVRLTWRRRRVLVDLAGIDVSGHRRVVVNLAGVVVSSLTLRALSCCRRRVVVDLAGVVVSWSTWRVLSCSHRVVIDLACIDVSWSTWRASTCRGRLGGPRRDMWHVVNVAGSTWGGVDVVCGV